MTANPTEHRRERRVAAGFVLALVGLALFWLNVSQGPTEAVVMAAAGAVFLALYFAGRGYGMLIPGCILLGLGLGELADRVWWGDYRQLGLGLGFVAIYVIDHLRQGRSHWWPLIPGVIITLSALGAEFSSIRNAVEKGWPLILVIIGAALMLGFGSRRRRDETPTQPRGPHESHGPHAD